MTTIAANANQVGIGFAEALNGGINKARDYVVQAGGTSSLIGKFFETGKDVFVKGANLVSSKMPSYEEITQGNLGGRALGKWAVGLGAGGYLFFQGIKDLGLAWGATRGSSNEQGSIIVSGVQGALNLAGGLGMIASTLPLGRIPGLGLPLQILSLGTAGSGRLIIPGLLGIAGQGLRNAQAVADGSHPCLDWFNWGVDNSLKNTDLAKGYTGAPVFQTALMEARKLDEKLLGIKRSRMGYEEIQGLSFDPNDGLEALKESAKEGQRLMEEFA